MVAETGKKSPVESVLCLEDGGHAEEERIRFGIEKELFK